MSNIKNRKESGFTIIEVLIVLAIAGLIMLIVFLAVPALQRNSRNTQVKNAASAVLGAVSEFQNNNNGSMPTAVATSGTTVTVSGATGTTPSSAKIQGGYTAEAGTAMPTDTGKLVVVFNKKCNGNDFATGTTGRAFAVGYRIEGASDTAAQCVES